MPRPAKRKLPTTPAELERALQRERMSRAEELRVAVGAAVMLHNTLRDHAAAVDRVLDVLMKQHTYAVLESREESRKVLAALEAAIVRGTYARG